MFVHPTLAPVRSRLALPAPRADKRPLRFTELAELVRSIASADELWRAIVRHDPQTRWYDQLLLSDEVEVWLIGWVPGQTTTIHDHGGSAGALAVVEGSLTEDWYALSATRRPHPVARRVHHVEATQTFSADHVHRVGNLGSQLATSVHAYSPPGVAMREYGTPAVDRSLLAEAS